MQNINKKNALYFIVPRYYTKVKEAHVCIKFTLKGEFSSITTSCVDIGSDYESQGCEFESFLGLDFLFCILFQLCMRYSQADWTHTNAWHSSEGIGKLYYDHLIEKWRRH